MSKNTRKLSSNDHDVMVNRITGLIIISLLVAGLSLLVCHGLATMPDLDEGLRQLIIYPLGIVIPLAEAVTLWLLGAMLKDLRT